MEAILAAMQLLAQALGAAKAYLELKARREEKDDHPEARSTTERPKHLKE